MSIHDILLPEFLEGFITGRCEFATSKVTSLSGREIRSLDQEQPRRRYLLKNCFLSLEEFEKFNNFFLARGGSRFAFLLRHFADYTVDQQVLAVGDGMIKEFPLHKVYEDQIKPYIRIVSRIKHESLRVYIDNQAIAQPFFEDSMIKFKSPLEQNQVLSASFEFYALVRFTEDSFDYERCSNGAIEVLNVSLIEVAA